MKVNAVVGCWLRWVFAVGVLTACVPAAVADQWIKPTPEELSMTSLPGYPGAPAVILFREQITKDDLHVVQHYERIKVLTEKGKSYANVELKFITATGGFEDYNYDDKDITDISGRTVHADGTVIPYTGKPYLKVMEKFGNAKYQARVFTLPDVEVGSIIEYRYATRISDNIFEAPSWYIQDELFTKAAHFAWYPTRHELNSSEGAVNTITWFPILPEGVTLQRHETPAEGSMQQTYEVTVHDIAPQPEEEFMPPIKSFTYRVLFAYSAFRSGAEFWKVEGKKWSKREDSFIGPDKNLKAATDAVTAGAQTQEEKLKKIYEAVMALENNDFTRDHGKKEDKASGVKISSAGDVYKAGRGSGGQLTAVFVGMARAAGMKAYMMMVPDRSKTLFSPGWMSFYQFDNELAIVNVDGKERTFDPGQRYCPFGKLAWQNTMAQGMRQTDGGTEFSGTAGDSYKDNTTVRVANFTMVQDGTVTGTIDISYNGASALRWRHQALRGDEESLRKDLRTALEGMLPKSLEVKVRSIDNLREYEKPLEVKFSATGTVGIPTGKRLVLPVDLFMVDERVSFPGEKRELPVYFHYPETMRDALRINLPPTMTVEAVPATSKLAMTGQAIYSMEASSAATNVTVRRTFLFNPVVVLVKDYSTLRSFYSQFQAKDQESIVLKMAPATTASVTPPGN